MDIHRKKPSLLLRLGLSFMAAALVIQGLAVSFDIYGAGLRKLGRLVSGLLGRGFSVLPFPVSEWLLLLALPALIAAAIVLTRRHGGREGAKRLLSGLVFTLGLMAILFVLCLGVQYGAPAIDARLALPTTRFSAEQLQSLTDYLLTKANTAAEAVPRGPDGLCDFGAFRDISRTVANAYRIVHMGGARYQTVEPALFTPAPPKQTLLLGKAMSYLGISGYYFPWTGEAVVSSDTPDVMLPTTIAHEAAHAHGIAPEAAANFVAMLACNDTAAALPDPALAYSTWFAAYIYASNALYRADYEGWLKLYQERNDLLTRDMTAYQAHLDQYATPVREAGTAVNDTYIKATGQPAGVQSYGEVVNLMLSWYLYGDCG